MSIVLSRLCILTLAIVTLSIGFSVAFAKSSRAMRYTYDQLWPTCVRFLRVDQGYPITEKDKDAGYIIFDYQDEKKTYSGSLELVITTKQSGKKDITIKIHITDRPSYLETILLDRLQRKLTKEYGLPLPSKETPAPPKKDTTPSDPTEKIQYKKDILPVLPFPTIRGDNAVTIAAYGRAKITDPKEVV